MSHACDRCLRRPWLLRELSGHLDLVRADIAELLTLEDGELIEAVAGHRRAQLRRQLLELDAQPARREAEQVGLELICRCDPGYPDRLRGLAGPPAALHVAGGVQRFLAAAASDPVAIVGSRRATSYGTSVARSLARGLAAAGVPVISGLALGIDSAAHQGALTGPAPALTGSAPALTGPAPQLTGPAPALTGSAPTVAVLPGPANQPYPRAARSLHRQLLTAGAAVSEIPPGVAVRSWMFLARNRIIAGLAAMTVVVEAGTRSGALVTARHARELERPVGAVPGRITSAQAAGPNRLIKEGAHLVAHAQDVLDLLFEAGARTAPTHDRPALTSELRALLAAIEEGHDTAAALLGQGRLPEDGLAALASLELAGYIARAAGGRFTVVP